MIKNVWIMQAEYNQIEADRFYFRYHGKEIARNLGPWLRRYETYRAMNAPEEADRFGALRGRLTELWYTSVDDLREIAGGRRSTTAPPGGWPRFLGRRHVSVLVPAIPTEDFLRKEPTPEERPIMRWVQAFRYPEGVSAEEGDAWYLRHAEETKEQPGLLRFVSHRALPGNAAVASPWHRVSELWYEDFGAWREAMKASDACAKPNWGGSFPFVDMTSTFVGNKPDVDFLRDNPTIP